MQDGLDYLLGLDADALRSALESCSLDDLEGVIIDMDNAEAKRWQRQLATEVFNQAAAQAKAKKMIENLSDDERAALVQHISVQGIENPFQAGKV